MALKIKSSAENFYNRTGKNFVGIDEGALELFAEYVLENGDVAEKLLKTRKRKGMYYFDDWELFANQQAYANAANACFWKVNPDDPEKGTTDRWTYREAEWGRLPGFLAWHTLIKDMMEAVMSEEGKGLKDVAEYFENLTPEMFREFIKGHDDTPDLDLQLIEERVENLNEMGKVIGEKYDGDFVNFLEEQDYVAGKIVTALAETFPESYGRDSYELEGRGKLYLQKRNVLLDIILHQGASHKENARPIKYMNGIPIASDYVIPKVLRNLGILKYSEELARKVDQDIIMDEDSDEILAIRAGALLAADKLQALLAEKVKTTKIYSHHIDALLVKHIKSKHIEEFINDYLGVPVDQHDIHYTVTLTH